MTFFCQKNPKVMARKKIEKLNLSLSLKNRKMNSLSLSLSHTHQSLSQSLSLTKGCRNEVNRPIDLVQFN